MSRLPKLYFYNFVCHYFQLYFNFQKFTVAKCRRGYQSINLYFLTWPKQQTATSRSTEGRSDPGGTVKR